jgi:hypothetical protein
MRLGCFLGSHGRGHRFNPCTTHQNFWFSDRRLKALRRKSQGLFRCCVTRDEFRRCNDARNPKWMRTQLSYLRSSANLFGAVPNNYECIGRTTTTPQSPLYDAIRHTKMRHAFSTRRPHPHAPILRTKSATSRHRPLATAIKPLYIRGSDISSDQHLLHFTQH